MTTALGIGVLAASPLAASQQFGITAAITIAYSLIVSVLVVPPAMTPRDPHLVNADGELIAWPSLKRRRPVERHMVASKVEGEALAPRRAGVRGDVPTPPSRTRSRTTTNAAQYLRRVRLSRAARRGRSRSGCRAIDSRLPPADGTSQRVRTLRQAVLCDCPIMAGGG